MIYVDQSLNQYVGWSVGFVNTGMNFVLPKNVGNFLTGCGKVKFSRRILLNRPNQLVSTDP